MRMYNQKQVEQLRKRYPEGTRLCLDFMDEAGMPPGLQGTVAFIDDAGQIHMHWEDVYKRQTFRIAHLQSFKQNVQR